MQLRSIAFSTTGYVRSTSPYHPHGVPIFPLPPKITRQNKQQIKIATYRASATVQRRKSTTFHLSCSAFRHQTRFRTHESLALGSQSRSCWCYRWWCGLHRDRDVLSVLAWWRAGSIAVATSFQVPGGSSETGYRRRSTRGGFCVQLPAVDSHVGGGVRCMVMIRTGMALHRHSEGRR